MSVLKVNVLAALLGLVSVPGWALQSFEGTVKALEPTYLPGTVAFDMDAGNAACPAGKQLRWQKPDVENNKAVYSTVMAALISKNKIRVYINDNDSTCVIQYLHLLSN